MSATQKQLDYIAGKIENIEQEKLSLFQAVEGFVSNISASAKLWINSKGSDARKFRDISRTLGDAATYLVEKSEEFDVSDAEGRDSDDVQQQTETESGAPDTTSLPLSLPAPASSSSPFTSRSSSLLSDHLLLKLQERMELVETKLDMTSGKMEELGDDMNKRMKKCEDTNSSHTKKITSMKTRFEGLKEQFEGLTEEYANNKSEDSTWLETLESKIGEVSDNMQQLNGDVEGMKEWKTTSDKRISKLDKAKESLEERMYDVEKDQEEKDTKLKTIEKTLQTFQKKLDKLEEFDGKLRGLEERGCQDSERAKETEDRLKRLEEETVRSLEGRLADIEEDRGNDVRDLQTAKHDISSVVTRLDVVEKKQQREPVGFSASGHCIQSISHGVVVKDFSAVPTNHGNSFDSSTGIFRAPVNGLYVATVSHKQYGDSGARHLIVWHEKTSPGVSGDKKVLVCQSLTENRNGASSTGVGVVYMKEGDKLCVKGGDWVGQIYLPASFSCFLLG